MGLSWLKHFYLIVNRHSSACDSHILAYVDLFVTVELVQLADVQGSSTAPRRNVFFPRSRLHLDLSNDNHCVWFLFFTLMCSDAILVRKVFCNNGDNILKYAQLKQQCCVEICFTTKAKLLSFFFFFFLNCH